MLLNLERTTAWEWDESTPTTCPECKAPLVAKRGDILIWHWAHFPNSGDPNCSLRQGESIWHLAMKAAYHSFGWQVEHTVTKNRQTYRLDACHPGTMRVREFVHSVPTDTKHLLRKDSNLTNWGWNVVWVFDACKLENPKHRSYRHRMEQRGLPYEGPYKKLLSARTYRFAEKLSHISAHRDLYGDDGGEMLKHWKYNWWWDADGPEAEKICGAYRKIMSKMVRQIEG